jgi:hypothetical protein
MEQQPEDDTDTQLVLSENVMFVTVYMIAAEDIRMYGIARE